MPQPRSKYAGGTLSFAMLVAAAGGVLDAVTYVVHHGVFASALSGNVVLLGITLIHRDFVQTGRHAVPIAATLVGVFVARAIRLDLPGRVTLLSLGLESLLLLLCGLFSGSLPGQLIVAMAAFGGAFQIENFRRIKRISYNSTFATGNLRDIAEGCYEAIDHAPGTNAGTRRRGRRTARDLVLIVLSFIAGVALGAALAPHFGDRALWAAIPLLAVAGALSLRQQS